MTTLNGKAKSPEEIRQFIDQYVSGIKASKHDRFHTIMDMIPEGAGDVLDYGCGWGHFSMAIRDKKNTVTAIDLSQNAIDICDIVWGEQAHLSFKCASTQNFSARTFDLVLSNQVIEHVHNVGNYLSEISRVIKDNGVLIISLPNVMNPRFFLPMLRRDMNSWLKNLSKRMLDEYDKESNHINAWDPHHFVTMLASVGFRLDSYVPTEGIPFPTVKPFKKYVYSSSKRFSNLSYTMTYQFTKVKEVKISNFD